MAEHRNRSTPEGLYLLAFTPNFDIEIPDVGADFDQWGLILNALFGEGGAGPASGLNFDTLIKANLDAAAAAQVTADAAVKRAGDAMTGRLDSLTGSVQGIDLAASVGAVNMDLALANFFAAAPPSAQAVTYSFANAPTVANGVLIAFISILAGGLAVVSWDSAILWPAAASGPVLATIGTDLIGFYSLDDGVTWYGSLSQSDVR